MTYQTDLQDSINKVKNNQAAVANLADEIYDKFDWFIVERRNLGPKWVEDLVYGVDDLPHIAWLKDKRDEAITYVNNMLHGTGGDTRFALEVFIVGMDLPVDLIAKAGTWRSIKNDVILAQAAQRATFTLQSTWDGEGAEAYESMRFRQQDQAFNAMINVAESTASELESIAKDVSGFYMSLQEKLVDLINTVKDFFGKILSLRFVSAFVDAVSELTGTIIGIMGSIVNALTSTSASSNRLEYLTQGQVGFSSTNQWPQPDIFLFSDFSTADGNGSDWGWK
ncbi:MULTISPECIES: WXG100 family type VII secretion target [unclassified Nocardia]|uniref:WXG100 family type VII secretion target n=1 Tax=unclassified Nocardia TaxID=2637762 RepID=UPI00278C01EA|nr:MULTISPECIES: hypothetical protein [unclassified Nocardia]